MKNFKDVAIFDIKKYATKQVLKNALFVALLICLSFLMIYATNLHRNVKNYMAIGIILLAFTFFCVKNLHANCRGKLYFVWILFLMLFNFETYFFTASPYPDAMNGSDILVTDMIGAKYDNIEPNFDYGLGSYKIGSFTAPGAYSSQYGLQGKFFTFFYKVPGKHFLCSFSSAFVMALICFFVRKKYNTLLSICFFITFWLSPWIVSAADSLYWVIATWFLPMFIGLLCSIYIKHKVTLCLCSFGAFVSVLVKSLCGYEFISVIMLAMIAFLLVDFCMALANKDSKMASLVAKNIFCLGFFALCGFCLALVMHANLRGEGNIIEGLKSIYEKDVLRRTLGGKVEDFAPVYAKSLEASICEVIWLYYGLYPEIISFVHGKYFSIFTILPTIIFVYRTVSKKWCKKDLCKVLLYGVFYVTCISWFVLGKSHSYIHLHLNFILWYFGFVQICFYVIFDEILNFIKSIYAKYFVTNLTRTN